MGVKATSANPVRALADQVSPAAGMATDCFEKKSAADTVAAGIHSIKVTPTSEILS